MNKLQEQQKRFDDEKADLLETVKFHTDLTELSVKAIVKLTKRWMELKKANTMWKIICGLAIAGQIVLFNLI